MAANEVFIVSSEQNGTKINIKAFAWLDMAEDFALKLEKQIKDPQTETISIEGFMVE